MAMLLKTLPIAFLLILNFTPSTSQDGELMFNGFTGTNLGLDGVANITQNGLLRLTNDTVQLQGHAFHPYPFRFGNTTFSFSTTFVFAIISEYIDVSSHGIAFFISPTKNFSSVLPSACLGLLNLKDNGNSTNHIFAVELDTILNTEFRDINNNHVGININSLESRKSYYAGYFTDDSGSFQNLSLYSRNAMQVWVDYDGQEDQTNVTLAPVGSSKPMKPLLSFTYNLSIIFLDSMYVGFSSSTGAIRTTHYILGWSFKLNGLAPSLDLSKLPKLPRATPKGRSKILEVVLPLTSAAFVLIVVVSIFVFMKRWYKYAELREDWEVEFGPHRFSYKDLYRATNGFKEKRLLGSGGFGRVYRGILPVSKFEVAVKKVSHESRQGIKQFIAEIVSIGQLRHRNIVQLLGYCRRKGELLLVYDYMPNGSLDKYLYDQEKPSLDWNQRLKIIKGVASGLLYLHEEWEQVIIHRDVKASNVLLDSELNGRLGDFGLARLYDHGTDPQTTNVVGTMGYIAPELARTGKATPATDVFAFGAFMLEVVCGRRPVEPGAQGERMVLVDCVLENWQKGLLVNIMDPRLRDDYKAGEVETSVKLGLLCSHPLAGVRPSMRQVMQYLDGHASLPELSTTNMNFSMLAMLQSDGFDSCLMSHPSTTTSFSGLSGGR